MKIPVIEKGFLISYSIIGLGAIVLYGVFGGVTWVFGLIIGEPFPIGGIFHPAATFVGALLSIILFIIVLALVPAIHDLAIKIKEKMLL